MTAAQPAVLPCIGICVLDPVTGFCRGCLRTGDEVAAWRDATDADRLVILESIRAGRWAGHKTASPPVS